MTNMQPLLGVLSLSKNLTMKKIYPSKKTVTILSLFSMLLIFNMIAFTNTSGPSAGLTGAPSEGNCTSCHSGSAITSGSNWSNISLTHNGGNAEYIPDSTYTFTLTTTHSGINKYGFELTALTSSGNNPAGTLSAPNSSVQKKTNTVSGKTREYIMHTSGGTAASSNAITWTFNWKAPSSDVGDIKFYVALNATNSGSNTSGDQVYLKNFTFKLSSQMPRPRIYATKKSYCLGDTIMLSDTGANVSSYLWQVSPSNSVTPSDTSSSSSPSFVFTRSGTIKFKLTGSNSIGKVSDSLSVSVLALPTVGISPSGTQSICQGSSLTISANTNANKILWNTGDTSSSITVNTPGDYFYTGTNSNGCQAVSSKVSFTVKPKPTIDLISTGTTTNYCESDTITLLATSGHDGYQFFRNGTLFTSGTSNTLMLTGNIGLGNYQVVSDSGGCYSDTSNLIQHEFFPKPGIPTVFCTQTTSNSLSFAWNSVSGSTGYEYSTDSLNTWNSVGVNDTTYIWTGLGNNESKRLFVRTQNSNNPCINGNAGSSSCTTGSCLTTAYSLSGDSVVCEGRFISWTITPLNTNRFSFIVNGGSPTSNTQILLSPSQNTLYKIEIIDSNQIGCPTTLISKMLYVESIPGASLTSTSKNICEGDTVEFMASGTSNIFDFIDHQGNSLQKGASTSFKTSNISLLTNGIQLMVTSAQGCDSITSLITTTVRPAPVPDFTINSGPTGYQYQLVNTSSDAIQTEWELGDGKKDTGKTISHRYLANGSYMIKMRITGSNGCTSVKTQTIQVTQVGIDEYKNLSSPSVFPNPFENQLRLTGLESESIIQITGMDGKTVWMEKVSGATEKIIDLSQIPSGFYILSITHSNLQMHWKVQKANL